MGVEITESKEWSVTIPAEDGEDVKLSGQHGCTDVKLVMRRRVDDGQIGTRMADITVMIVSAEDFLQAAALLQGRGLVSTLSKPR